MEDTIKLYKDMSRLCADRFTIDNKSSQIDGQVESDKYDNLKLYQKQFSIRGLRVLPRDIEFIYVVYHVVTYVKLTSRFT